MKYEEILNMALNKAEKGGFKIDKMPETEKEAISVILTDEFARAFWGEGKAMKQVSGTVDGETRTAWRSDQQAWEVHVEQMKACDNPFEYLAKFV